MTSAWGCGDGIVDPRSDVANASAVDPGPLHVRLTAPPQARDIGAMLVVEGPAIDSLQAPGLEMFETDESSSTRREVIIAGALPDGPLLQVWVPHRGDHARYRVRLLQVAAEDFTLGDLSVYGIKIQGDPPRDPPANLGPLESSLRGEIWPCPASLGRG